MKSVRIGKVVLIEPGAPGYHVYSRVALPRLGLPMVAAVLRREGYRNVRVYCEDIAPLDMRDVAEADFVGMSTTTSTALRAYRLGSEIKRLNPKAVVVIGGIHVTFMSHEPFDSAFCAANDIAMPVCDHVIVGEAESLLPALMHAIEDGPAPDPIVGTRLRETFSERIPAPHTVCDLDSLPFPDLDSIVGRHRMKIAPIMTSRGCPFDCP
ncbi:MAG: hypothetical protein FJX72_21740, partial [Armatimonadetes bacterium]|nr:hypothetical protein [Armatimonadota bacterium]